MLHKNAASAVKIAASAANRAVSAVNGAEVLLIVLINSVYVKKKWCYEFYNCRWLASWSLWTVWLSKSQTDLKILWNDQWYILIYTYINP